MQTRAEEGLGTTTVHARDYVKPGEDGGPLEDTLNQMLAVLLLNAAGRRIAALRLRVDENRLIGGERVDLWTATAELDDPRC